MDKTNGVHKVNKVNGVNNGIKNDGGKNDGGKNDGSNIKIESHLNNDMVNNIKVENKMNNQADNIQADNIKVDDKIYTFERKKRLAAKIAKLKKKEDLVQIVDIISEEIKLSENQYGMFMVFNKLSDKTYEKIEQFIASKKRTTNSETLSTEKKEYIPYAKDEFPEQEKLSPKYKYSNKERNIIKRQRYDDHLNNNNNVIYKDFDANMLSDSEKITSEKITSEKSASVQIVDHKDNKDNIIVNKIVDDKHDIIKPIKSVKSAKKSTVLTSSIKSAKSAKSVKSSKSAKSTARTY